MRLIGTVESEKQAFVLYSVLLQQGIHSTYERDSQGKVSVWIYEEDQIENAQAVYTAYKENPNDPKFAKIEFPKTPPLPPDDIAEHKKRAQAQENPQKGWRSKMPPRPRKMHVYPLTYLVILICVALYLISGMQSKKATVKQPFSPIQQVLLFEYPPTPQAPVWNGLIGKFVGKQKGNPFPNQAESPQFIQIREGEVWRLFTPSLLHGGFLHILFNMLWTLLLLKQVEERVSRWKILILIVLIGSVANIAQYLVSGPFFLGFSGVVVGLVGFIWMRQKNAPWEGYPLPKSTVIFILVFVGAMFALEIFSLLSSLLFAKEVSANIANTAHIVGGLIGLGLGRLSFFSRGLK